MNILLERDVRTEKSTTGKLYIDGVFECFVLEDKDRKLNNTMSADDIRRRKIPGNTAIPAGKYKVSITYSQRFKKMLPLLNNVPGFEGIRIHPGNTDADTEGCLLPGVVRLVDFVGSSRVAFERLNNKIEQAIARKENVIISIR